MSAWRLAACLPVFACVAPDSPADTGAAVEHDRWVLSEDPVSVIGVADGRDEYELSLVSRAFRLSDGRTVVVNSGTGELRYYDAGGAWLRSIGGYGEGPGEFGRLTDAGAIRGDTVVAWDQPRRRVTLFDPDGEVVDDFPIPLEGQALQLAGYTARARARQVIARHDGDILVVPAAPASALLSGARSDDAGRVVHIPDSVPPDGVYRISYPLYVVDRDGQVEAVVAEVGGEEWLVADGSRRRVFFGHDLYVAGGRERFVVGSGKPASFISVRGPGDLSEVPVPIEERPLTPGVWDAQVERALGGSADSARRRWQEFHDRMPRPQTLPAYSALLADEVDRVWIGEFLTPEEEASGELRQWHVLGPDGEPIATLRMPAELRVTDVSYGHVTGVVLDEHRVYRVVVYSVDGAQTR